MRNDLCAAWLGEILLHRSHCYIISRLLRSKVAEQLSQLILANVTDRFDTCDLHSVFGDSTCFVNTQHIGTGKCLDTFHIVHKYFLLCKSHCAYSKCDTCKKEKSFGYHSDDRSNGRTDTLRIVHCFADVHIIKLK